MNAEFVHDSFTVGINGLDGTVEQLGYLFGGFSISNELKNLIFTAGQAVFTIPFGIR